MKTEKESQKLSISRVLYTILFLIIGRFVAIVVFLTSIFQIIHSWIYSQPNKKVLEFTNSLSEFAKQIVSFVGFNTEEKPWPFGEWVK